jgi:hypothetical protein
MGLIYATMGEHQAAVERFQEATNLDQYLAVAYAFFFHCESVIDRCIIDIFSVGFPISYSEITIWHTKILTKLYCIFEEIK